MLDLKVQKQAMHLKVRVQPKASRDAILGEHDGALKVAVTAAPEKGKANKAVAELLAKTLRVPKSNVTLVAGAASRVKTFAIAGASRNVIEALAEKEQP